MKYFGLFTLACLFGFYGLANNNFLVCNSEYWIDQPTTMDIINYIDEEGLQPHQLREHLICSQNPPGETAMYFAITTHNDQAVRFFIEVGVPVTTSTVQLVRNIRHNLHNPNLDITEVLHPYCEDNLFTGLRGLARDETPFPCQNMANKRLEDIKRKADTIYLDVYTAFLKTYNK